MEFLAPEKCCPNKVIWFSPHQWKLLKRKFQKRRESPNFKDQWHDIEVNELPLKMILLMIIIRYIHVSAFVVKLCVMRTSCTSYDTEFKHTDNCTYSFLANAMGYKPKYRVQNKISLEKRVPCQENSKYRAKLSWRLFTTQRF